MSKFGLPKVKVNKILQDETALQNEATVNESINWAESLLGIPDVWEQTKGKGVRVAVLDTGIDLNHPDLKSAIRIVIDIRRAALDALGHQTEGEGIKEYLFSVVLHMLRYAAGLADEMPKGESKERKSIRVWHALYGAAKAAERGLGAFAIVFLATITAVGGGVIRDIAIRKVPEIFYRDFYASPAIALGIVYAIFGKHMHNPILIYIVISCTFVLRLVAMHFGISLWTPGKNKRKKEVRAGCCEKQ